MHYPIHTYTYIPAFINYRHGYRRRRQLGPSLPRGNLERHLECPDGHRSTGGRAPHGNRRVWAGLEVVDPTIINKPSSPKEKGVPGKEKEVAAPPKVPGTTPRGPNFEKTQRKREKRQRLKKRPAEAAGTEASRTDPKPKDPAGNAETPTTSHRGKRSLQDEETRNRFLCDCEGYCNLRIQIFGRPTVSAEELPNIPLPVLIQFIYRSGRLNRNTQGDNIPAN
jgi:hypothetical protein